MANSRIQGFFRLSLDERRAKIASEDLDNYPADASALLDGGGLDAKAADQIVENVLGIYSLPFGVALNALINGEDRLIPMVVEEPSVIAAASNACKMIRAGGGFVAKMKEALMIAQIELRNVKDPDSALAALEQHKAALLKDASIALSGLVRRVG